MMFRLTLCQYRSIIDVFFPFLYQSFGSQRCVTSLADTASTDGHSTQIKTKATLWRTRGELTAKLTMPTKRRG